MIMADPTELDPAKLLKEMQKREISVVAFCRETKIGRTTFYNWVDGRSNPSPRTLRDLTAAYHAMRKGKFQINE